MWDEHDRTELWDDHDRTEHATPLPCRTFTELWNDDGETEQGRNELINKVYNFVDIPTVTVGDEAEMPLISFGTGPAVENETRWEIKQAIQAGHRSAQAAAANDAPHTLVHLCYEGVWGLLRTGKFSGRHTDQLQSESVPLLSSLWLKIN